MSLEKVGKSVGPEVRGARPAKESCAIAALGARQVSVEAITSDEKKVD
jgi:hypothetical protein